MTCLRDVTTESSAFQRFGRTSAAGEAAAPSSRRAVTAPAPSGKPRKVPRIIVLGGGSVGLYAAHRLRRRLGTREAAIVIVWSYLFEHAHDIREQLQSDVDMRADIDRAHGVLMAAENCSAE